MTDVSFQVRVAVSEEDRLGAMDVRRVVFIVEQGVSEATEMDQTDGWATHLVAVGPPGVVGTARIFEVDGEWHIGRVAVLAEWRRHGIGSALMALAAQCAEDHGALEVTLHSQTAALPFYTGLGYVAEGQEFMEAGITHRRMRLQI